MSCQIAIWNFSPFLSWLPVKNLVGDTDVCGFVIYDENLQIAGGVSECGWTGKCQWLDKRCCSHYFVCALPCIILPSASLVFWLWLFWTHLNTCCLKPFSEGRTSVYSGWGEKCSILIVKWALFTVLRESFYLCIWLAWNIFMYHNRYVLLKFHYWSRSVLHELVPLQYCKW